MSNLVADLRHALRDLRSHKGFTVTAVLTLALGIGATTTVYGILDGIVLRPLAFPNAERLITICEEYPGATADWCSISPPNAEDIRSRSTTIASIGIGRAWPYHLATVDGAEAVTGGIVTPDLFRALGVRPVLGRLFDRSDLLGTASVVSILSYEMWQTRFGAANDVVGRRVVLDGTPITIIGVLPRGFQLPKFPNVALWRTVHINPVAEEHREWRGFVAYGLLRDGATLDGARTELAVIAGQLRNEHFSNVAHWDLRIESLQDLVVGGIRPVLMLFLAAVLFILLIACVNVANLLLTRAGSRAREFALRAALGASRWQLVRGLLVESLVLALAGGALGIVVAHWGMVAFKALAPTGIPRLNDVGIDGRVLAFTLLLSVATTVLFGLAPALIAARADLATMLREGGRSSTSGGTRSGRILVITELSLALTLLSAAGLITRSFAARAAWNPGFERDHLMTFSVFAPIDQYPGPEEVAALLARVERDLGTLPGVKSVGEASGGPLFGGDGSDDAGYTTPTGAMHSPAMWYDLSPSYFATLGVPVLAGRGLSETDRHGLPTVALVNEALAKKFWPGRSPLDKELSLFSDRLRVRVVGVVRDVAPPTPGLTAQPEIYWSNRQQPRPFTFVVLHTSVDPASVMPAVRARLREINPNLRPANAATMSDLAAANLRAPRFQTLLLVAFSLAALALAAIGTYGLFAYRVSRQSREIGIRIALGARGRQIMVEVLRDGLSLAAVGLAVGVAASLLSFRVMGRIAVGVSAFDPLSVAVNSGVLVVVTIAACFAPARRAASVDPSITLSAE